MSGCMLIFVEKSFTDCPQTTKLMKLFLLESFLLLYGTYVQKTGQVQRTRLCDRKGAKYTCNGRELYEEHVLEF